MLDMRTSGETEPVIITPSGNHVEYPTNDLRLGVTKHLLKISKSQNPVATMAGFAAPSHRPPARRPKQTSKKRKQRDLGRRYVLSFVQDTRAVLSMRGEDSSP